VGTDATVQVVEDDPGVDVVEDGDDPDEPDVVDEGIDPGGMEVAVLPVDPGNVLVDDEPESAVDELLEVTAGSRETAVIEPSDTRSSAADTICQVIAVTRRVTTSQAANIPTLRMKPLLLGQPHDVPMTTSRNRQGQLFAPGMRILFSNGPNRVDRR
jgi:hypothetical protein